MEKELMMMMMSEEDLPFHVVPFWKNNTRDATRACFPPSLVAYFVETATYKFGNGSTEDKISVSIVQSLIHTSHGINFITWVMVYGYQ